MKKKVGVTITTNRIQGLVINKLLESSKKFDIDNMADTVGIKTHILKRYLNTGSNINQHLNCILRYLNTNQYRFSALVDDLTAGLSEAGVIINGPIDMYNMSLGQTQARELTNKILG